MIGLLLACYPRAWRARYEDEFRALLEAAPLTVRTVLDVLAGAARQHARVHVRLLRLAAAVLLSAVVEIAAKRAGLTANVLWAPTTPQRALALGALTACWLPVLADLTRLVRRRYSGAGFRR